MICAAVMVCTGHSVWLICQHCPEKDSSETICPDLRGEVMPGLLHYRFLACSPETTLHHQNEQAANYRCCYWLLPQRVWGRPTEERMLVKTKPRKGAPQPEVHVGGLQESCPASGNSTSQQAQAWQFFVEILGHNSAFWSNKNLGDHGKHPIPDKQNFSELCTKRTAPVSSTSSS